MPILGLLFNLSDDSIAMKLENVRRLAVLLVVLATPAFSTAVSGQSCDVLRGAGQLYIDSLTEHSGGTGH